MKDIEKFLRVVVAAAGLSLFSPPAAATVIYVSNFNNDTVTAYDYATGALLGTPVTGGAEASGFNGIRIAPDGGFLIAGQFSNNVLDYSQTGKFQRVFDPANTGGLNSPQDLTYGPDGKLYVVSSANDEILRYDPVSGNFLGVFANLGTSGHIGPVGLAFGPDGNLYVTSFDNGQIVKVNGQTGAVLSRTPAPSGLAFAVSVFGPDGDLYTGGLDKNTFLGSVYRFDPRTDALSVFIAQGTDNLQTPGALAFAPNGDLLVSNLLFDENGNDIGSTVLEFNGNTGTPIRTLIGVGEGLDVPTFLIVAAPEPASIGLLGMGVLGFCLLRCRHA